MSATAQQADLAQSGLVGELENPTIVTDPAQWPKKFHEAPTLAELVKAGKLPPGVRAVRFRGLPTQRFRAVRRRGALRSDAAEALWTRIAAAHAADPR